MKLRNLIKTVASAATALSVFTASLSVFPMNTSAVNNQLNIKIYMDQSMCTQFNTEYGNNHITRGTYGVPTSFTTRFQYVTSYVYSFYMYHGAQINFYSFNPATDLLQSPAYDCANNSSSYLNTLKNGCSCYSEEQCDDGTLHHNNCTTFKDDLPYFDPDNGASLYLTASAICYNPEGGHSQAHGITWSSLMTIIVNDSDYKRTHPETGGSPYTYTRSTMAHEIGHLYNVRDHYNINEDVLPTYDPNCIWGNNHNEYSIKNACRICSICASTIRNNANIYHHT